MQEGLDLSETSTKIKSQTIFGVFYFKYSGVEIDISELLFLEKLIS